MSTKNNRLILKDGTVFDSHSGKLNENTTIVIVGRKIAWIGDDGSFEKEKGDKILAVTGKTILPGLIETHVHLDATGNPQYEREILRTKTHMWPYIALHHAQQHLVSGFTCVRDCGANPDWSPSLRRILDHGILAGPRLVVSDRFLGQPGTQEFIGPEMYLNYFKENYEIRSGPEGVMDAVRERKLYGSDFIKTATTGGVLHGIESKIDVSFWTDDELQAMATEAHRIGMHIACHAHGNEGIYRATKFGIDTIEHGSLMTEETADLMVKKGTYLVPTHSALHNLQQSDILKQMPSEVQRKTIDTGKQLIENHKMAFKKGVLIAIGTDAGTPGNYHGKTGTEVKFMVENVGMTPTQAMQAATIHGAKAVQMDDKIGSLEVGKIADIVISNKNPLEDITILENPKNFSHVIKDGKIMVEKAKIIYFKE